MGSLEDDLTEYHRMQKRDAEIEALRKRVAELEAQLPDPEMTKQMLEDFSDPTFERDLSQIKDVDRHMADKRALTEQLNVATARAEQAEKRVAELESGYVIPKDHAGHNSVLESLQHCEDQIRKYEERVAELEALVKRMSLAADSNGLGWMPLFEEARDAFVKTAELEAADIARQLASCRRMLDQITDKGTLAALRDANDRAEQAEKRAAELEEQLRIMCVGGEYWKTIGDLKARAEAAEARLAHLAGPGGGV